MNGKRRQFSREGKLEAVRLAPAGETSFHINGKRYWLHVASTDTHTHYHVHERRGFIGIDAGGVWSKFRDVMMHDGWAYRPQM